MGSEDVIEDVARLSRKYSIHYLAIPYCERAYHFEIFNRRLI